jgi:hypothetical protein
MWDIKFNQDDYLYGKAPNKFIAEESKKFDKNSQVICYGEGEGRNAVFLAKQHFKVTALEPSTIGIEKAKKLALINNVSINFVNSFVEEYSTRANFDYAISSFMHVPKESRKVVFFKIIESLKSGGFFVGEFFSKNQLKFNSGGPKDSNLLYSSTEMKQLFYSFENCNVQKCDEVEIELIEGKGHNGKASVLRIILEKK